MMVAYVSGQGCDCLSNFEFVRDHIERNYPGFQDKVTVQTRESYDAHTDRATEKAASIREMASCVPILYEWIAFFRDGHIQLAGPDGMTVNRTLYPNYHHNAVPGETGYLDFKMIAAGTAYLKISSFNERIYAPLDSLLSQIEGELREARYLVLDLRGNEGGATFVYRPLLPYLYTDTIWYTGFDVLASPANIDAYERQLESPYLPENQKPYVRANIERMKEHAGQLIPLSPDYYDVMEPADPAPHRILVLVDGNCGSTCEHFLLAAQQSKKVQILGEPTIGMYDYGDMRSFEMPCTAYRLYCATNRSRRLNKGAGIDQRGIIPDIPLNRNKDWIREALLLLKDR